jgi:hypothetical protein
MGWKMQPTDPQLQEVQDTIPVINLNLTVNDLSTMLGFATGLTVGRAFKRWDYMIQQTEYFRKSGPFKQWLIKSVMDCLHHWQIGLVMMILSVTYLQGAVETVGYTLGWGLFISDLADYKNILKRYNITEK